MSTDIPTWGEHNLHQRIKKRQSQPDIDNLKDKILWLFPKTEDYPYTNLGEVTDQMLEAIYSLLASEAVIEIERWSSVTGKFEPVKVLPLSKLKELLGVAEK